jgi:hypothetical protein
MEPVCANLIFFRILHLTGGGLPLTAWSGSGAARHASLPPCPAKDRDDVRGSIVEFPTGKKL